MRARAMLSMAALAAAVPALAQERFTDPFGGSGGQQYVRRCPAGALVTGVVALVGAYVNNIAPICDGRTLPGAGGTGNRRSATCPNGSAVTSIGVVLLRSDNRLVKALSLKCVARGTRQQTATVRLDTPGAYSSSWNLLGIEDAYPFATIDCGGQDVTGLQGRAGVSVDALGLICNGARH